MEMKEKTPGAINLISEIEIRRRVSAEFDTLLSEIERGGLSVVGPSNLDALLVLLSETIEARKSAERQEKVLKAEVRRHFAPQAQVLETESAVAILDARQRTDLDRDAIRTDFGQGFFDKYGKTTNYETLTVKEKKK